MPSSSRAVVKTAGFIVLSLLGVLTLPAHQASAVTLPVELFNDETAPRDDPNKDDSKIAIVYLDAILRNQVSDTGRLIGSLDNPSPVKLTETISFSQTTGYTKSISSTLSTELSTEVSASHIVGTKIGAKIGTSVTIGTELSEFTTRTETLEYCAACEKFDVFAYDIFDLYKGRVFWYKDTLQGNIIAEVAQWSASVFTGTSRKSIENYMRYSNPECVPVPASLPLFLSILAATAVGARIRNRRSLAI